MELRAPSHLDKGGAQSRADFGGVISADIDLIRAHFKPRFDLGLLVNSWVLEIPRKEGSGILLSAQFHLMQLQDSRERESAARV